MLKSDHWFPDPDDAGNRFCGKDGAGTRQELGPAGRAFTQFAPAKVRHWRTNGCKHPAMAWMFYATLSPIEEVLLIRGQFDPRKKRVKVRPS
jgi:hypothetical protein